jgi:hypothetical protein
MQRSLILAAAAAGVLAWTGVATAQSSNDPRTAPSMQAAPGQIPQDTDKGTGAPKTSEQPQVNPPATTGAAPPIYRQPMEDQKGTGAPKNPR